MFAKLTAENRLGSFKAVVDEHYRYHQFYGGCAVALVILYAGGLRQTHFAINKRSILTALAFLAFEWLLATTAADAFKRYVERGTIVAKGEGVARAAAHR